MAKIKKPCGLLITLEKNALGQHQSSNNYILGYYDRLAIEPIDHWLTYSPRNTTALGILNKERKRFLEDGDVLSVSNYPIKLIFPTEEVIAHLENQGLDYASWQCNYLPASPSSSEESMFDVYSCISVILINLTDQFKGNFPRDFCDELLKSLSRVIENSGLRKESLQEAHCCLMPSLGYSDYCILLAEKDWKVAPKLMRYLHAATVASQDGKAMVPVLSTDYLMPAYHVSQEDVTIDSTLQLAVRVNLQPGTSMEVLTQAVRDVADVFQTSGPSDCIMVSKPEGGPSKLVRMLMPRQAGGDSSIEALVISTESFLQGPISPQGMPPSGSEMAEMSDCMDKAIQNLGSVLEDFQELIIQSHRHQRQLSALYERVVSIQNVCRESHNLSLQLIMRDWVFAFSTCLDNCITVLKQDNTEDNWVLVEEALGRFISQVGSFLADLSRSDCFFMETERYNHPSVSSATMLLIAYNRWLNSFAGDVIAVAGIGRSKYRFLVRSGGCDCTETTNIFWFLEAALKGDYLEEELPLIIQMSEMSLFDCGGTVFRMTHECMHFCGNRERRKRAECLIRFVARYYANILASVLFHKGAYLDLLTKQAEDIFQVRDSKLLGHLNDCYHKNLKWLREEIANEIETELNDALEAEKANWTEADYMSAPLKRWMQDNLSRMFACYSNPNNLIQSFNQFADKLYFLQLETVSQFYEECSQLRVGDGFPLQILSMDARQTCWHLVETKKRKLKNRTSSKNVYTDQGLERWVPRLLSQLLMTPVPGKAGDGIEGLRVSNVGEVLECVAMDSFSEAFADLEACIRLDVALSDYIVAFIYEKWDLDVSLAQTEPNRFRIPIILRTCFSNMLSPDQNRLSKAARKELEKAVTQLEKHGMPKDRIDTKALIQHVDALLDQNDDVKWIAEALENYLKLCQDNYFQSKSEQEKMERYQQAFQKIRILNLPDDSNAEVNMFRTLAMIG